MSRGQIKIALEELQKACELSETQLTPEAVALLRQLLVGIGVVPAPPLLLPDSETTKGN